MTRPVIGIPAEEDRALGSTSGAGCEFLSPDPETNAAAAAVVAKRANARACGILRYTTRCARLMECRARQWRRLSKDAAGRILSRRVEDERNRKSRCDSPFILFLIEGEGEQRRRSGISRARGGWRLWRKQFGRMQYKPLPLVVRE